MGQRLTAAHNATEEDWLVDESEGSHCMQGYKMGFMKSFYCKDDGKVSESPNEIRQTLYAYYPGLEQQLDMAFSCHDINCEKKLSYTTLEPVIRHLLMQYGLIEYIARFVNENGELDINHVTDLIKLFKINIKNPLSSTDFKSMAIIWLKKTLMTHINDQEEWVNKLKKDQYEQSRAYMEALTEFQQQCAAHEAFYQQGIEQQENEIARWNQILQDCQKTQQELYEAEVKRTEELREKEHNAAINEVRERNRILSEYRKKIAEIAAEDKSNYSISFAYSVSATPHGACISAGSQEPVRRKRKKKDRSSKHNGDGETSAIDFITSKIESIKGCC